MVFEQISRIQNQFSKTTIQEDDLVSAALTAAPDDYAGVIAAEQVRDPANFGLGSLEKAMMLFYRQKYGDGSKKSAGTGDTEELVLSAFNGTCFNCGEKGHRKHECPNAKKKREQPKFKGTCRH